MSKYVQDNEWKNKYPHFSKEEFTCPCCGNVGIGIATSLVELLETLREKYGAIIITSGYRCPSYNSRVGGVNDSRHLYGQAADFTFVSGINENHSTRINIVNEIKSMPNYHYSYCNVNGNYPGMGCAIHVDTVLTGDEPIPTPASDIVTSLQTWLNQAYSYSLAIDGIFGQDTKKHAVMALQHEFNVQLGAGIAEDGIFGPATKGVCPNMVMGYSGNITKLIQYMLSIKGFATNPDGIYGYDTQLKIKEFQMSNGLISDGICGPNTFEKLFN